jgi:hypothetical protein
MVREKEAVVTNYKIFIEGPVLIDPSLFVSLRISLEIHKPRITCTGEGIISDYYTQRLFP